MSQKAVESGLCLFILSFAPFILADPIVIAHRGASGYLPEHTIAAYELAISQGADYIEPDLVISKDGVLVVRHDRYLSTTTDVATHSEFESRKKESSGRTDWFVEDFTLVELKTLRAKQAFRGRSKEFDANYAIPTLSEVIALVKAEQEKTGREVGIYPETKSPAFFESLGFDFADLLLKTLEQGKLNATNRVFIQSFEPDILSRLATMTDIPLVLLVVPRSRSEMTSPNFSLREVASFVDGIGAHKVLFVTPEGKATDLVTEAHDLGLIVHAWTFRNDAFPSDRFQSAEDELRAYLELGIDGFFTDFPDTGVSVRNAFVSHE